MAQTSLHPSIDGGVSKSFGNFSGGTLTCKCPAEKVTVRIDGDVAHNHACGCSKCWKPEGALFSIVGVVPVDKVTVTAHEDKLQIVDANATIQRHACKVCGTHMFGRIVKDHPFKGLDFVHVELSDEKGWQAPQFAAFVSSIIEQGYDAGGMDAVRGRFKELGLPTYDALSPALMDAIATFTAQKAGTAYPAGASSKPVAAAPPKPAPATSASAGSTPPQATKQGGIAGFFSRLFGG